jgi:hypothetical protein
MPVTALYKSWDFRRSLAENSVFLECCVLCQIEALKGPTDCGVSECHREDSIIRRACPIWAVAP